MDGSRVNTGSSSVAFVIDCKFLCAVNYISLISADGALLVVGRESIDALHINFGPTLTRLALLRVESQCFASLGPDC